MKTAISLPDDLYAQAEAAAKRKGVSRSKLMQMALTEYLKRQRSVEVTKQLNASYAASPEPYDPYLTALARENMRRTEWNDEAGRDLVDKPRRAKRVRARVPAARRHRLGK